MRPSRLSVEHRPHLEVVLDDPGTRLDPTRVYRGSISKEDFRNVIRNAERRRMRLKKLSNQK